MYIRNTARVLLIDERRRVLLFHIHDDAPLHPDHPQMTVYWITPGGGCEPGESFEGAARRELQEETGICLETLGPCVWHHERRMEIPRGPMLLHERFFLAHVVAPQVRLDRLLPYERLTHRAYRWWGADDLAAADDTFLPLDLPRRLPALLAGAIPAEPLRLRS